jgi:hypothetical protein
MMDLSKNVENGEKKNLESLLWEKNGLKNLNRTIIIGKENPIDTLFILDNKLMR